MRKEDLGLSEAKMLARNKLQDLQRAKAEGDADKEAKARMELAKIEKDFGVSINTLLGKEYSGVMDYLSRTDAATLGAEGRKAAARINANKPDKEKALERLATAKTALVGMEPGTPQHTRQLAIIKALEETVAQGRTSDMGPTRASIAREQLLQKEDIGVQAIVRPWMNRNEPYLDALARGDEAEAARLYNIKLEEARAEFRKLNPAAPAAPAAAPAAPAAAKPAPPAGFNTVK